MTKRELNFQHRSDVLALAEKYGASGIRIFGSVARGDARPDSDLDLIVRFEDGGSLHRLCGLADELEELFGCKVDLLTDTQWIQPRLRANVEADAVAIEADQARAICSSSDLRAELHSPAMPIYEYEPLDGACKVCGGCFQLNRPVSRADLTECPLCKKPVRKRVSNFSTPKASKAPSVSEAKNAGFTILKRIGKGEYERQ